MPNSTDITILLDLHIVEPGILLADVEKACMFARDQHLASICIPALFTRSTSAFLQNSGVCITACVGFPYGFQATEAKLAEILLAMVDGASELEVLINYTAIKNADWGYVANEITHILPVIKNAGKKLSIVIEAGRLSRNEMVKCCELYSTAEVDTISVSTGKSGSEPSVDDLKLIRSIIPASVKLKSFEANLTLAKMEELAKLGVNKVGINFDAPVLNELLG